MSGTAYWDRRAGASYSYSGEVFYTITPVPYYRARRKWLLDRIKESLSATAKPGARILDFGCGDGFYCRWLRSHMPRPNVVGYDPSPGMIESASRLDGASSPEQLYTSSQDAVRSNAPYEAIVCIAVLAHVSDQEVRRRRHNGPP